MDYQWIEIALTTESGERASFHTCEKPGYTLFINREWCDETKSYTWNWRVVEELKSTSILRVGNRCDGVLLEAMEHCQKAYEGLTVIPV